MSSLAALVVVASSLLGQAKAEVTKQDFREFGDRQIGQWVIESPLPLDVEEIGKAGDTLTENRTVEWVSNQTALLEKRVYRCNDKIVLEGVALTAWDGPNKKVKSTYFDSLGGNYHFAWTKKGGDWVLRYRGVFGDGLKDSGTSTMTFSTDGNTITLHDTDVVYGDNKIPDRTVDARRVKK